MDGLIIPRADLERMQAERDSLLKALKAVMELAGLDPNGLHKFSAEYQQARAAVDNAEGQPHG